MTFTANVDKAPSGVKYQWMVSAGTIESGQGTASIEVATTLEMAASNVTATVTIKGLTAGCRETQSDTGSVADIIRGCGSYDSFGKLGTNDVKARIQNLYIRLNNDQYLRGVIVNYGSSSEKDARRKQILKAIDSLRLDQNRVTIIEGPDNSSGVETKLWLIPLGAADPEI